ncbi:uncharacterized protein LOC100114329 isoform X2 [Nasonia vitripennis]|uniref:DUF4802 domain-containing protein n=2 Tax=Nasonia vitripennis TaxID=7425 RepID=A0A7M7HDV5_NASVI|nr:uncharacterized protein LOC100114329 isoform X2 [Nasonia vitripennis]
MSLRRQSINSFFDSATDLLLSFRLQAPASVSSGSGVRRPLTKRVFVRFSRAIFPMRTVLPKPRMSKVTVQEPFKLAPFKLRFSKLGKSRSGDSGGSGSRSNSVEVEESAPVQPAELNQLALGSSESVVSGECAHQLTADASSVVSVNTDTSTMPASSPPPSYERVLEETRLARSMTEDEEAIEESTDEGEAVNKQAAPPAKKGQEILYKSSKDFYRAMAKQWGITCKMSDNCRCFDCQSRYFDCGYEKYQDYDKYHEQSDGGLSASTPMFVSEVMHGSACLLL